MFRENCRYAKKQSPAATPQRYRNSRVHFVNSISMSKSLSHLNAWIFWRTTTCLCSNQTKGKKTLSDGFRIQAISIKKPRGEREFNAASHIFIGTSSLSYRILFAEPPVIRLPDITTMRLTLPAIYLCQMGLDSPRFTSWKDSERWTCDNRSELDYIRTHAHLTWLLPLEIYLEQPIHFLG